MSKMGKYSDLNVELAKSYKFVQEIEIKETSETKKQLENYIQTALDTLYIEKETENEHGPFYKVKLCRQKSSKSGIVSTYIVNFYLVSLNNWSEEIISKKLEDTLPESARITSERLVESLTSIHRNPTCTDALWEDEEPGCSGIKGSNFFTKFLHWWLIVPRTQYDFFDLLYQMYTFDITHQGFLTKCIHFFTIPINAMLSMMFLAQFDLPFVGHYNFCNAFAVNAVLILLVILGVIFIVAGILRTSILWGVCMFLVLTFLAVSANLWYYSFKTEGNPWYNPTTLATNPILLSYLTSFIQAASHLMLPQVPPNITGVPHWESFHLFLMLKAKTRKAKCKKLFFFIASCFSFPVFSVAVTWFSWPHLLGTEIIYIMAGIGYRREFFERFYRIVEKAERLGNPTLDRFPMKYEDLRLAIPRINKTPCDV